MKRILSIARNELYSLFYSPIAWMLMILFLVISSADYIRTMDMFLGIFERGGFGLSAIKNLTSDITSNPKVGYFIWMVKDLYIFFPLMTMGLISREMSSGTIKLLFSSPIRIREIILGKYFAILVFTLCLLALFAISMTALSLSVVHPDVGQLLASMFGLFLLFAAYSAIGLFMSSLTTYQIVAAMITFALFAFLSRIDGLWQGVDILRDITYYLNLGGKSFNFLRGLFNLRDFCYFIIIITSFLAFTVIRIKSATESISPFKKIMRYVAVIVPAFIIGYITNQPTVNVYWDTTRNDIHTITPPTQQVLSQMNEGELKITVFANLLSGFPFRFNFQPSQEKKTITMMFEPYIRFKPDIKVNFVYYYGMDTSSYYYKLNPNKTIDQIAKQEARTYHLKLSKFLTTEQAGKLVDIKSEEYRNFFLLEYKGKKSIVRTFDDNDFWPFEDQIAAGIKAMIADQPKIAFVSDQIARGPFSERNRDYRVIANKKPERYSLVNQGYLFDTVQLETQAIPDGLSGLVIADPRKPLSDTCLKKINNYIDKGGNLLITAEPDRKEVMQPVLSKLGLSFRDGLLIQPSEKFSSDIIFSYVTDSAKKLSPQFDRFLYDEHRYFGDTVFRVALAGAGSFAYEPKDGFTIEPMVTTDKDLSWNRLQPVSDDSLQTKVGKLASDETGSFIPAVKLKRNINGKEQRIFVTADADYLSQPQLYGMKPNRYNMKFGFWCFSQFSYGQYPTNTLRPLGLDAEFKIKAWDVPLQKKILYWVIPILIGVAGSVILIRRKRK